MGYRRTLTAGAVALSTVASLAVAVSGAAAASATTRLSGTASSAAIATPRVAGVDPASRITFDVTLALPNRGAAVAFARAVSTPRSSQYRHYLTARQWEARFSPTAGRVAEVEAFLRGAGFTISHVSADRMTISVSGTASQIEKAFKTRLGYHLIAGKRLRIAEGDLSVPASLAHIVLGVDGINQVLAKPASTVDGPGQSSTATPGSTPPQPPGFRVAHPCGAYYGQIVDTMLPPFGNGYPSPAPWAVCGYTPPQFRSAYHLSGAADGTGVTVAIVDAYLSPTLLADGQTYAQRHDPTHPLLGSQFAINQPGGYNLQDACGASGWYGEQTLDVEAVHATAPGANILYTAGSNCAQTGLNEAVARIVDGHLADVITNSYGDNAGDVLDPPSVQEATDNTLLMAAATGISVLFSSGDSGDEFTNAGAPVPDFPASSPWATSVGGTSLQVGAGGQRTGEFGWSTARSFLCNPTFVSLGGCTNDQLGTWLPIDEALDGGSGGGTSYVYTQPFYQAGVVPASLSQAHSAYVGDQPMRVEPDIAAEADPATGMLVGETQTFPNGVYYDEYRIGGTSVSSPLTAGIIARADQQAGTSLGFLNPALYSLYRTPNAFYDILPAGKQDMSRADFANSLDESQGKLYTTRIVDYEGQAQFCESSGKCRTEDYSLRTAKGYDNMTGLGSAGEAFVRDLAGLGPFTG